MSLKGITLHGAITEETGDVLGITNNHTRWLLDYVTRWCTFAIAQPSTGTPEIQ